MTFKKSFMVGVALCTILAVPAHAKLLGYTWPYESRDVAKEIGSSPIVLELFTTQACMFCPVADRYFNDLTSKIPNIIGISCHIDYFDVKSGSLSKSVCSARQDYYAEHIDGAMNYTPQMVVNGNNDVVGYKTDAVLQKLITANKAAISPLVLKRENDRVVVSIPEGVIKTSPVDVWVALLRKSVDITIADGANKGQVAHYTNVVEKMSLLKSWPSEKTSIDFKPLVTNDTARIVVLIQDKNGIHAAGQIDWPQ